MNRRNMSPRGMGESRASKKLRKQRQRAKRLGEESVPEETPPVSVVGWIVCIGIAVVVGIAVAYVFNS